MIVVVTFCGGTGAGGFCGGTGGFGGFGGASGGFFFGGGVPLDGSAHSQSPVQMSHPPNLVGSHVGLQSYCPGGSFGGTDDGPFWGGFLVGSDVGTSQIPGTHPCGHGPG